MSTMIKADLLMSGPMLPVSIGASLERERAPVSPPKEAGRVGELRHS
jgi:hypothetical protein